MNAVRFHDPTYAPWWPPATSGYLRTSLHFIVLAAACLIFADIGVTALTPWLELQRLLAGILHPDVLSIEAWSVVWTVAFATLGVAIGATCGLLFAVFYSRSRAVRALAIALRSIHELFWALL